MSREEKSDAPSLRESPAHSLDELLARVAAESAHLDRRLSYDLLRSLLGRNQAHAWLYGAQRGNPHSSLDAALALYSRVFPGWAWCMRTDAAEGFYANVYQGDPNLGAPCWRRYAPTAALALLAAMLSALQAQASESNRKDGASPQKDQPHEP